MLRSECTSYRGISLAEANQLFEMEYDSADIAMVANNCNDIAECIDALEELQRKRSLKRKRSSSTNKPDFDFSTTLSSPYSPPDGTGSSSPLTSGASSNMVDLTSDERSIDLDQGSSSSGAPPLDGHTYEELRQLHHAYSQPSINPSILGDRVEAVRQSILRTRPYLGFQLTRQHDANEYLEAVLNSHPALENVVQYHYSIANTCIFPDGTQMQLKTKHETNLVHSVYADMLSRCVRIPNVLFPPNGVSERKSFDPNNRQAGCHRPHTERELQTETDPTLRQQMYAQNAVLARFRPEDVVLEKVMRIRALGDAFLLALRLYDERGRKITRSIHAEIVEVFEYNGETYHLSGMVFHIGDSLDSGHYVAHVRRPDNVWYLVDDENVRALDCNIMRARGSAQGGYPYILLYSKRMVDTPVRIVGIQNRGNTCYANASMQILVQMLQSNLGSPRAQ